MPRFFLECAGKILGFGHAAPDSFADLVGRGIPAWKCFVPRSKTIADKFNPQSYPSDPVRWIPVKVCDGKNDDLVGIDPVKQAVRETVYEPSMDVQTDNRPTIRMLRNIRGCRIDLVEESVTQTWNLQLVVLRGVEHLLLSGLQKAHRRHLICFLTSRIASAAGLDATRPCLYS
jgi:hypothetical protein